MLKHKKKPRRGRTEEGSYRKIALYFLIPIFLVTGLAIAFLELGEVEARAKLSLALKENDRAKMLFLHLFLHKAASILLEFSNSSIASRFIASSYRTALGYFFNRYILLKYAVFSGLGASSLHYKITKRAEALTEFLSAITISLVTNICFFLCIFDIIRKELPFLGTLKILLLLVLFFIVSAVVQLKRASLRLHINKAYSDNSTKALDVLMGYELVIAFDNVDLELAKYSKILETQARYKQIYEMSYELITFINQIFLLGLIYSILTDFERLGARKENILSFILVSNMLRERIFDISRDIDHMCVSYTNMTTSAQLPDDYEDYSQGIPVSQFRDRIEIKNLSFAYENKRLLDDVTVQINRGERVAITGPTGTGKSLFMKILQGLYDYHGSIKLDGLELRNINRSTLTGLMRYVPQCTYLFDKTIIENLRDGNPLLSDDEIRKEMKKLDFDELFSSIGYDRRVGERGTNLSGGQRQKLCFSRAVLSEASIVLMDRACSNMDMTSELRIIDLIQKNMGGKTVINIIDSMFNLEFYDKIIYFQDNMIVESGDFSSLMDRKGKFYTFYTGMIANQRPLVNGT